MKNKLLLIGVDKYNFHTELPNCVKDITDLRNILLEKYEFAESDIWELYNEKATNKNIQDALSGYGKTLNREDNLIIYFSGHGAYNLAEERGFWIPYDGTKDYTSWIPNETIIAFIQRINCKHIFLISDSCFSHSLLINEQSKSNNDYNNRASRWALTSAFDESYTPKDANSNSLFAESIIEYLEEAQSDFRITKLIEYVKDCFSGNVLQTPQGSPIKVHGHKGGEMILKINHEIDDRVLKGYGNFQKVLKIYKKNASFNEVATFEDKTKKIGFQLYKELDPIVKSLTYYLYLYAGITQTQTLKYLKDNYGSIFGKSNLIIFVPKELNQVNTEKRKNNIKNKFRPTNIFYIDEFIRTACLPQMDNNLEKQQFLQISNFILPSYYNSNNSDIDLIIDKWLLSPSEPIIVIKGTGGIGKTTFAQYIVDNAIKQSPNISVLFIDSVKIKDNLLKRKKYVEQLSVYNFYEALFNQGDSTDDKLSEEIFKLNLDAGNILLIIDGLDEVISKIPNFDVEQFLASISTTSNELGGGKVIITCRTHFWNQTGIYNEFDVLELKPFNKKQTIEFFNRCFENPRKREKALKFAKEFKFSDYENENEDVYHPYVLDIIRSILELEKDDIELDMTDFSSSILNRNVKNDYIIYRVCDRERKRIGQISIDEQIRFFIYLAIERRGIIQTQNFKREIEEALKVKVDNINIEAFKSHPFLQHNGNTTTFRYDFFSEIFKGIYLVRFFDMNQGEKDITLSFLSIISESCWYGSSLNSEIVSRIDEWSEDDFLMVSDIIEKIANKEEIKIERKREVIANIFNIALLINHKFHANDIEANTLLLKAIFENPINQIKNLSVINLNTDKSLKFNFNDLNISEAYIDNYNSFYQCYFNEKTRFINSHILNIDSKTNKNRIPKSIFVDCVYDKNVEDAINEFDEEKKSSTEKAKMFLNSFFHLFYSNGRLGRQWEDKVIKPRFKGVDRYNFGYKKVIRILKRNNILFATNEAGRIKFFINDDYKGDVVRYVKDGTISKPIANLIKLFSEN